MIGIAGLTLGILGAAFTLVGLISYAVIPGLGMLLSGIFVLIHHIPQGQKPQIHLPG